MSSESLTHVKRNLGGLSLLVQSLRNSNRNTSDVIVAAPLRVNTVAKQQNRVLPQSFIIFFLYTIAQLLLNTVLLANKLLIK